jgi:hypothetical protein
MTTITKNLSLSRLFAPDPATPADATTPPSGTEATSTEVTSTEVTSTETGHPLKECRY